MYHNGIPHNGKTLQQLLHIPTHANFNVSHRPWMKLHSILLSHKGKDPPNKQPGAYVEKDQFT